MKRTKIIAGIILAIIDIAICVRVGIEWNKVGCSGWAFFAETVFYTMGCYAFWMTVKDVIEYIYRHEDDIFYGPKND